MRLVFSVLVVVILLASQRTAPAPVPVRSRVVTAAHVNGTWRGPRGEFRVWALGKQQLRVEFSGIYEYKTPDGPIANLGEARGNAIIDGQTAVLRPNGTDDRCTITMTFKRARLVVEEHGECGFGRHVSASGEYRKVSGRKPKFG